MRTLYFQVPTDDWQWSLPKWPVEDEEASGSSVGNSPCFALGTMMGVMEQWSEGAMAQTELAPRGAWVVCKGIVSTESPLLPGAHCPRTIVDSSSVFCPSRRLEKGSHLGKLSTGY